MKRMYWLALFILLGACTPEVGSERWCEKLQQTSKSSWSFDDGVAYTKHCLVSQMTVGSEGWCEKLAEKPKSDWTVEETRGYARYCVVRMPDSDEQ